MVLTQCYSGDRIKKNGMVRALTRMGGAYCVKGTYRVLVGKPEAQRDHLVDTGADGRIIL